MSTPPVTLNLKIKLIMFPRILYLDSDRALELNWFGFGALQIRYRQGPVRKAHPIQKRILMLVVEHFAAAGQPVNPANPRCLQMLKDFTDLLEDPPSSLAWQAMFNADLQDIGRAYAEG